MAELNGMIAIVHVATEEECKLYATKLSGKPFLDEAGKQIGTVGSVWVEAHTERYDIEVLK